MMWASANTEEWIPWQKKFKDKNSCKNAMWKYKGFERIEWESES